ncbi:E3 ubiquitin-protein ligase MSL2a [Denticeps clupeoides]|uniref:E3 ubiquitin-protein ligase MSL2 n=1 Tax=Denticeps clupeoides TaxID=299321 RepID=A0AAY4AH35_9TELE|nr:E3 ubiquitin-protein ligase MSL2-like [Denticeps clupeoides]XP_028831996.1 E3 ubiquitin-protein ligase MSL2-like [Denticeps clupeoides]
MNPANATALYLSACRSAMRCDGRDPEATRELCAVLPFFRDALSCLVCGNLLQDPIAPTNSTCQHYVCKGCKGKRMSIRPSCSWCKDYEQFEENRQLAILVECYRKLCEYISDSPLLDQIASCDGGSPEVMFMLEEVLGFKAEVEESEVADGPRLTMMLPSKFEEDDNDEDSPQKSDVRLKDSEVPSSGNVYDGIAPSKVTADKNIEAPSCELSVKTEVCDLMISGDLCIDYESVNSNGETALFSVEEVLENLESGTFVKDAFDAVQRDAVHLAPMLADAQQSGLSTGSVSQPQKPQFGISCSAATPRTMRLNRKRSHSESDSEKIKPLPIASFMDEPPVASPAPLTETDEPKGPQQPFAKVPNGDVLKVNKTLVVTSKNFPKIAQVGHKKVCGKAKSRKPKDKKERLLSGNVSPVSPVKMGKKTKEKKGCKCGRATQNPSVLTCRGQRCPCYSTRKACLDCICRGCQNSYMPNGEKKLAAFAVPEKALEQTRLTLGINYASILNVPTNSGIVSLTTNSSIASFLGATPHSDHNFSETLGMQFNC